MALPLPMPPPARQTTRVRTPLFLVGVGLALVAFIAMFAFGILFASRSSDGAKVPVVLNGKVVGHVEVSKLFPDEAE